MTRAENIFLCYFLEKCSNDDLLEPFPRKKLIQSDPVAATNTQQLPYHMQKSIDFRLDFLPTNFHNLPKT